MRMTFPHILLACATLAACGGAPAGADPDADAVALADVVPGPDAVPEAVPEAASDLLLDADPTGPVTLATGPFVVTVDRSSGEVSAVLADEPDRPLWRSAPGRSFVGVRAGHATFTEARGSVTVTDAPYLDCPVATVREVVAESGRVVVRGDLDAAAGAPGCDLAFEAVFLPVSDRVLGLDVTPMARAGAVLPPAADLRVVLSGESVADERFWGFGVQYSELDLKGRVVPVVVQEQGIGRGLQPLSDFMNQLTGGSAGSWSSTYAAVPQYVTSRGRGLFLENPEYAEFDLSVPDRAVVTSFASAMHARILAGHAPLDLIEAYTGVVGRMRPLPAWMDGGAIVGMQGGTQAVLDRLQKLETAGAPIAAFWLQDWVGQRHELIGTFLWWNWEVDAAHYPDWAGLVATLAGKGIRVLTYLNPMLVDPKDKGNVVRNLYQEAHDQGLFVQDAKGADHPVNLAFTAYLLDLSRDATRAWVKGVIRDQLLGSGASGWMGDFGESLPFDGVIADAAGPLAWHNRYPLAWQQVQAEAVAEAGRTDDVVFFSRSGTTRSPGVARLFWLGDQLASWDAFDGLKTVVTGLLSAGFAGFALEHADIGGYTSVVIGDFDYHRTKELFLRGCELSAFTAAYRTHEGSRPDLNWQFWSDAETLAHFARFAGVHKALAPYRRGLMDEAATKGWPLVRALPLHYPDDPAGYGLRGQFLLGSEYLVLPVLDEGAVDVTGVFPAGTWVGIWDGAEFAGGATRTVPAPIGRPAVFFRKGSTEGARLVAALIDAGLRAK